MDGIEISRNGGYVAIVPHKQREEENEFCSISRGEIDSSGVAMEEVEDVSFSELFQTLEDYIAEI